MATYAIGDIQGCFATLQKLLEYIEFDPAKDSLWFTGDLVNRGPQSLATLRYVKQLGNKHRTVLGNHDLHLLALAHNAHPGWKDDTLSDILTAPDRDELLAWLASRPFLHYDKTLKYCLVHAGLAPAWSLSTAQALAEEMSRVLQSDTAADFFKNMYGDTPLQWTENLTGFDRWRCITNYFTRMRFCNADGSLDLTYKGNLASRPQTLLPWFNTPHRQNAELNIIFGHWAELNGVTHTPHVYALDTGCVWGFTLTAYCLETQKYSNCQRVY
jgi:bis(5'-nucleosyl)-tetraphosphatase (symmetrical)